MKIFTLFVAIILATTTFAYAAEKDQSTAKADSIAAYKAEEKARLSKAYSIGYELFLFPMCLQSVDLFVQACDNLDLQLDPDPRTVKKIDDYVVAREKWDKQIRERLKLEQDPEKIRNFYLFGGVHGTVVVELLTDFLLNREGKINAKNKPEVMARLKTIREFLVVNKLPSSLIKSMDANIAAYKKAKTTKQAYDIGLNLLKWNIEVTHALLPEE